MTVARWSALGVAGVCGAVFASLAALVWVHQWAVRNTDAADFEHQRLIVSTLLVCALLAWPVVVARLVDPGGQHAVLAVVAVGCAAAFVAVAASAASTLLIAMAISPATDPGEFGRPLLKVAYVGALILSLCAGVVAASVGTRRSHLASVGLALILIAGAWGYLAAGSSGVNQCVAASEFPLTNDHVCSGC